MSRFVSFRFILFYSSLMASLTVPMLPLLLNGAPFIGDSWVHIKIAKDTVKSGIYQLEEYNERWPLVNFIIAYLTIITAIPEFYASQVVPLIAGLAVVPFYCLCRRLGLSRVGSAFSIFFLNFNPLYSYVTFTGAVMKETATYYLTIAFILVALTVTRLFRGKSSSLAASILMGLGVVFGHHYAGLILLIFLWAYVGYTVMYRLKGELNTFSGIIVLSIMYTVAFSIWNLSNYLALAKRFPLDPNDFILISALIIIVWYSVIKDRGILSSRFPWLVCVGFIVAISGLRGGVYLLVQSIPPVSLGEAVNYLVAGAISIIGLGISLRLIALKAYATSVVAMLLFAFLWGFTFFGFVLLIKSLHYFCILIALGGGFTLSAVINAFNMRKKTKVLQSLIVLSLIGFLIYASWTGARPALNGLGAYEKGEVESARALTFIGNLNVYGDSRLSFLLPYVSGLEISGLKPIGELNHGSLFLLAGKNLEKGFLIDYDWIAKEAILDIDLADNLSLTYNTGFLQVWLN